MGTKELRGRDNWQTQSGPAGKSGGAEDIFSRVFQEYFVNSSFSIIGKPRDFINIYKNANLPESLDKTIYHPETGYGTHGIIPDYAIRNASSGKTLYVEVKRQDGWVEGKPQSAGRGNAHERGCKYFTPGLMKILRERSHISPEIYPFWLVYIGDITRDPKRVREIITWFGNPFSPNFFFWQNTRDAGSIIAHFERQLKPYLL